VSVDPSGNIYVGGNGTGFSFAPPPPVPPLQCGGTVVSYGGLDLEVASPPYLLKVNPGATSREWLQSFADCGTVVQGIALDSSGRAWLGGIADGAAYDTVSPFQTLAAGSYFVRQYASDARTLLFSTLLDSFQSIALDSKGAAYIAADGTAPGISKQFLNGSESQPSAAVLKIDASVANPLAVDTVQKTGTLSIPALADYSGPIGVAGGELVTLNGHGLGPSVAVGAHVTNGFVDTSLAGVAVQFDGAPAPLISVQNNQIVCVAPYAVSRKQRSNIQIINNGISSNMVAVSATPAAVEVLQLLNQDGTVNSAANPAPVGSTMTAYVSGLGVPNGPAVDGQVGSVNPQTFLSPVSVVFNDPAKLTYVGSAPGQVSGITQINFIVPAVIGQSVLSVNAGKSTDFVFVYVR
jgi:uncharacterized protein (TIGR03437 family)